MSQEVVEKNGEQWLVFSTYPGKRGLHVHVKAHPKIEEFMRSLGDGQVMGAQAYDNRWFQVSDDQPLNIYNMKTALRSSGFSIERPSQALFDGNGSGLSEDSAGGIINLSFLRIKGISDQAGVEFGIKDVYPLSFRRVLKRRVGDAFRTLVMEHVRPTRITLIVSGQEF